LRRFRQNAQDEALQRPRPFYFQATTQSFSGEIMALASTIIPERHRRMGEDNDPNGIIPGMLVVAVLCLSAILFRLAVVAATPLELDHGL
jgi:hypothetical protein